MDPKSRGKAWCVGLLLVGGLQLWSCSDAGESSVPASAGNGGGGADPSGGKGGGKSSGQGGAPESGGQPSEGGSTTDPGAGGEGGGSDNGFAGMAGAAGAAGGDSGGGAPIGLVTFFDASECPSGWQEAADARGRLIVSTLTGAEVGQTTGTALGDREERLHSHAWTASATIDYQSIAAADGSNVSGGAAGPAMLSGNTERATSELPFTQLLACRLSQNLGQGDPFPLDTVAHFDTAECPSGWSINNAAEARVLMPAPDASGVSSGSGNDHFHPVAVGFTLALISFVGAVGGGNNGVAVTGPVMGTGATGLDTALGGLPTQKLLVCHKDVAPVAAEVPPAATLAFVAADSCPETWERASEMEGRFLVGAPDGALLGAEFGGPSLSSGEQALHDHAISGNFDLEPHGIGLASGCCGAGNGAAGPAEIDGSAQETAIAPLRLELRYCRKL